MLLDQPSFLILSDSLEAELPGDIWARVWTLATYWYQDSKIHLGVDRMGRRAPADHQCFHPEVQWTETHGALLYPL